MDEKDNAAPEEPKKAEDTASSKAAAAAGLAASAAKDAAKTAAKAVADQAGKTAEIFKEGGIRSFFNFDKLYFPEVARPVYLLFCALIGLVTLLGLFAGIGALFSAGIFTGLSQIVQVLITGLFLVVLARFWFEFMLVGFKIHENTAKLRELKEKEVK